MVQPQYSYGWEAHLADLNLLCSGVIYLFNQKRLSEIKNLFRMSVLVKMGSDTSVSLQNITTQTD